MTTGKPKIIKNNYCQIGKSGLFLHKMQKYARATLRCVADVSPYRKNI